MATSVSFDRVADRYDETRGGLARGRRAVDLVAEHLPPGRLLEVGAGTGLVTVELAARGWEVLGVDLSPAMLARAQERVPGRVVVGDALRLPVADGTFDAAIAVHVLHLVGDVEQAVAEVARVLRPGGRFAVLGGREPADDDATDVQAIMRTMNAALRDRGDRRDRVLRAAQAVALTLVDEVVADRGRPGLSPAQAVANIESRTWSALWDIPDARWTEVVEPALTALRALPDQDRPRARPQQTRALVFERP